MPALEALLSAALEREALLGGVVETASLRRADVVKTALLRAVSHDLRSPLTAISAAGEAVGSPSLSPQEREEHGGGHPGGDHGGCRAWSTTCSTSHAWRRASAEPRREWMSVEEVIGSALEELAAAERRTSRCRSTATCRSCGPIRRSWSVRS